jgi:hypothetical protein
VDAGAPLRNRQAPAVGQKLVLPPRMCFFLAPSPAVKTRQTRQIKPKLLMLHGWPMSGRL